MRIPFPGYRGGVASTFIFGWQGMSKTLIIHIGHFKTGTTALQVFFREQTEFMAEVGIEYPLVWADHSKHSDYIFSILRAAGVSKLMHNYENPTPPQSMWNDLFERIKESPQDTILISSEEFMRIGQFPKAQDILRQILDNRPPDLTVKAIVYLRDPRAHLQSWYNQLIKMNFQVAALDMAVNGDIESIHYDYQRALAPWVDILGGENVIIRPYLKDPANPAALHQDFMGVLGVDLPDELLKTKGDPNPSLDNRVIELVRLMQNMDFPQNSMDAVRSQALAYLEMQDRQIVRRGEGMTSANIQARAGLDWLSEQPGCHVDTEAFAQNLPEPGSQEKIDQDLLLGFVFSELVQLRQRVKRMNIIDINQRLEALERQVQGVEAES